MDKIDLIYDAVQNSIQSRENFQNRMNLRLERIEKDIEEFKEFKGRLSGICMCISFVIGLVPHFLSRYL